VKKLWLLIVSIPLVTGACWFVLRQPELEIMNRVEPKYNSVYIQEVGGRNYARQSTDVNNELGSIHTIFLAGEFVRKFGLETRIPKYKNLTSLDVAKSLLKTKNYSLAQEMWNDVRGLEVQKSVRQLTSNNNIKIGNALGCVEVESQGIKECKVDPQANSYSERDLVNYLAALDKSLLTQNTNTSQFLNAMPGERQYQDFVSTVPNLKATSVVGTIQNKDKSVYSVAGQVIGSRTAKKYYYTFSGTGNSNAVYEEQLKFIKILHDN
jgi:hypothetical protein